MAAKAFGIDFGTSVIKICIKGKGVVLNEPNIVAIADKKDIIASGNEAYEMFERAPSNIEVTYPVRSGVIADVADMTLLLKHFMYRINKSKRIGSADYIVAIPTDITEVEKLSFYDLISSSNLKIGKIKFVEKPIADAVGIGLDIMTARGAMVVNIGADTTEVSILSLGGIVLSRLIPVGGNQLDESIKNMVKRKYNLYIGNKTAENLKVKLAYAYPTANASVKIYGRDVVTGLPMEREISSDSIYESIQEHLYSIIDSIKLILERTPPEIASDIIDSGIFVTGGSAKIFALDELIHKETGLKVNICPEPSLTVVNGLYNILEDANLASLAKALKPKTFAN